MTRDVDIRGGATEFEAAVIAVVLDRLELEAKKERERVAEQTPALPSWVQAVKPDESRHPLDPWRSDL